LVSQASDDIESKETTIASRNAQIPITFVYPGADGFESVPLVVMAHGHGGSREEAGGFTRVAIGLARAGIASIRMDFSGCGDSTEPFTENYLANMLADIRASREFATGLPGIDANRVGILGYSMGGRLAMLSSVEQKFKAMALWNPVGTNGEEGMIPFLGGTDNYERLRDAARAEGAADFVTPWGDTQRLSWQWFEQMGSSTPLSAIGRFEGALLVLFGEQDEIVDPQISRTVAASADLTSSSVLQGIGNSGHGLGFYSDNEAAAEEVVSRTIEFFRAALKE
jgi:dienelactone hydrolase